MSLPTMVEVIHTKPTNNGKSYPCQGRRTRPYKQW